MGLTPRQRYRRQTLRTVILSGARSERSDEHAESKDPYPLKIHRWRQGILPIRALTLAPPSTPYPERPCPLLKPCYNLAKFWGSSPNLFITRPASEKDFQ